MLHLPASKAESSSAVPAHIQSHHWQEWLNSGVAPGIIDSNVRSLEIEQPYDYLLYSEGVPRRNDGRVRDWILHRYAHVEEGGWWCAGVDLLEIQRQLSRSPQLAPETMRSLWGQFKPDRPFIDSDGKAIKYEGPLKAETRVYCLFDPANPRLWLEVLTNPQIPIIIVEGAKKAGCLLTLGYVAIALPGIFNGCRKETKQLIDDLAVLCTPGRPIYICFDFDQKQTTRRNVRIAISRLGRMFRLAGCIVRVIMLPGPEKGVDDFVVSQGSAAFQQIYENAPLLEQWEILGYRLLTYEAQAVVAQRYLGGIQLPAVARLVGLAAPKGTGKTETIVHWVDEAIRVGQPVLVLTHRIQLGQALCDRFGLPYLTEIRESETGAMLGFGLCVDSLHPLSQARFNADRWHDALVIIDEAEQVIWHALNAATEIHAHRVAVLGQLKQLLLNTLRSGGKGRVVLSDADLSDLSLDFVKGLAEQPELEPWIIRNDWKPEVGCSINHYNQTTPVAWYSALEGAIAADEKVLVLLSGQAKKSTWGTQNLEARLRRIFPDKRILRIDSESIADPSHEAFGCISRLNQILPDYDVVLASPSLETGVSIDLKGHFGSVWGCFQGNCPADSVRQALSRLREQVDRHLWVASRGIGQIGNGSSHHLRVLQGNSRVIKAVLRSLRQFDFDDIDTVVDPVAERTWAKMAARINADMGFYRQSVLEELKAEGHQVIDVEQVVGDTTLRQLRDEMLDLARAEHRSECEAIAQAEDCTAIEAEQLEAKRSKTAAERFKVRKFQLKQRYGVDAVTSALVERDAEGWYPQVRLHYYLFIGRCFLEKRDNRVVDALLKTGNGSIWSPDLKPLLLFHQVRLLESLKISSLLTPGREIRNSGEVEKQVAIALKANPGQTKDLLGITVNPNASPVVVVRQVLGKLGLKLRLERKEGERGKQERIYQIAGLQDGRDEIFRGWRERDQARLDSQIVLETTVVTHGNINKKEDLTTLLEDLSFREEDRVWLEPESLHDVGDWIHQAEQDPSLWDELRRLVPATVLSLVQKLQSKASA